MTTFAGKLPLALSFVLLAACQRHESQGAAGDDRSLSAARAGEEGMTFLEPAELAKLLSQPGEKPLLIHVGFRKLYEQAHIPGSEYFGPGADDDVLARLRERVRSLPPSANIVLYCGCCPWEHCPNVKPAFAVLRQLGFTNVKVLMIPRDFGEDWVSKGFPVAKGA